MGGGGSRPPGGRGLGASLAAAAVCLLLLSASSGAQSPAPPQTRAEEIERERRLLSGTPVPSDDDLVERAIVWGYENNVVQIFTRGWHALSPTLGGMVNRSGLVFGTQFLRTDLAEGEVLLRASARLSTKLYELYDLELGIPAFWNNRMYLDLFARRRNYPRLDYYGPGQDSDENGRSNYRLEDMQFDVAGGVRPTRWLRAGLVGGYYIPNVGPGTGSVASTDRLYTPSQAPGINRQPSFLHGGGLAQIDYRDNPYGPRSGGNYYARFDYWDPRGPEPFAFRRLTGEVQQFIPVFNKKRVIAARAKTILSFENPNQQVPFFLQPSMGGSDNLRGFRAFRFYDNNSVVANVEWRWEAFSVVDGAVFFDTGKVFPRPGLLNLNNLERSYGVGLRFREPVSGAVFMRWDVAFSNEGVRFWFTFDDIFGTPQVRTGRELSPQPGRLP